MPEPRSLCSWCTAVLFTLGLTALVIWLSYLPIRPRYFIVSFQLPPISNGTAPGGNATANFTLEVENKNKRMGVLHDPLTVTLSYGNRSAVLATVPGFYQGHSKTADKAGEGGAGWVPWGAAATEVAAKGAAAFRVGVATGYRYKVLQREGRHHAVRVEANVEVDGQGRKKAKKGIRLSSACTPLSGGARRAVAVAAAGMLLAVAVVAPPPLMLF